MARLIQYQSHPSSAWISSTTTHAAQAGSQAKAATAAFEAAFAMTVSAGGDRGQPCPVSFAECDQHPRAKHPRDRSHLSTLRQAVDQDVTAMYAYAAVSATAAKLPPYNPTAVFPAPPFGSRAANSHNHRGLGSRSRVARSILAASPR